MSSGEKKAFPVTGMIQSSSRIVISQPQPQSQNPGSSKPQSYKVFVLPPSQLNNLGLIAKTENGRVILTQRPAENTGTGSASSNSSSAVSLSFIKSDGGIQIQSSQPSNVVKTATRKSHVTSGGESVKGGGREMHRQPTKITPPGASSVGSSSETRPMFSRRPSNRRLLPQFTKHWKSSLDEVGYIRCPLRGCNYICLSFGEMTIHYYQCKGEPFPSKFVCTPCNGRLKSKEDLQNHLLETHSREGRIAKQHKKIDVVPKQEEKTQVWIRKRAYSKVHKISWNISLEEKGYVNCFFKNCCFMALNLQQMIQHYGICNGTTATTAVGCSYCGACAESKEKLEAHVEKTHASSTQVVQVTSSPLTIPVQNIKATSASTAGVNTTNLNVSQSSSVMVQPFRQPCGQASKVSVSANKTVQTILSVTSTFPEPSLDETQSVLYTSDTCSATAPTINLPSTVDSEVHCLFSMYEDFEEQPMSEKDLSLDTQSNNVSFSVESECENTNTVLCKTYSKDNQRLVKDVSYTERISSPLGALPCSFSDNISFCTDVPDVQVMRSSMSEVVNSVMLVEAKPEASAVEKLHNYMSNCKTSHTLNDEDFSTYTPAVVQEQRNGTEDLTSQAGQSILCAEASRMQNNTVSSGTCSVQYEIFSDTEPEYSQEYNTIVSTDKGLYSSDINLQNDLSKEDKQVTIEECLFAEPCTSSSLVSYTDVDEYIIPEIMEIPQLVLPSAVAPCNNSSFTVGVCGQRYGVKQSIDLSEVPVKITTKHVPEVVSKISSECKIKQEPRDTVEKLDLQDNSIELVRADVSDVETMHPLFADTDDIQIIQVPDLSVDRQPTNSLSISPNSHLIDSQNLALSLSKLDKNLCVKEEVCNTEQTPVLKKLVLPDDNQSTCSEKIQTNSHAAVSIDNTSKSHFPVLEVICHSDQSLPLNTRVVNVLDQCNVEENFDKDTFDTSDSQSQTSLPSKILENVTNNISDQHLFVHDRSIESKLTVDATQISETLKENAIMLNDTKLDTQVPSTTSSDIHTEPKEEIGESSKTLEYSNCNVTKQSIEINTELSNDTLSKPVVTSQSDNLLETNTDCHEMGQMICDSVETQINETSDLAEHNVLELLTSDSKVVVSKALKSSISKESGAQIVSNSLDTSGSIQIVASELIGDKINYTEKCVVIKTESSNYEKLDGTDSISKHISKDHVTNTSFITLQENVGIATSQILEDNASEHDAKESIKVEYFHDTEEKLESTNLDALNTPLTSASLPFPRVDEKVNKTDSKSNKASLETNHRDISGGILCPKGHSHVVEDLDAECEESTNQITGSTEQKKIQNVITVIQDENMCVAVGSSSKKPICSQNVELAGERRNSGTLNVSANQLESTLQDAKEEREISTPAKENSETTDLPDTVMSNDITSTPQISGSQKLSKNEKCVDAEFLYEKGIKIITVLADDNVCPETRNTSKKTEHLQEMKSLSGETDYGILEVSENQLMPSTIIEVEDNVGIDESQLENKVSHEKIQGNSVYNVTSEVLPVAEDLCQESQKTVDEKLNVNLAVTSEQSCIEMMAVVFDYEVSDVDSDISKKTEDNTNSNSKGYSPRNDIKNDDEIHVTHSSNEITIDICNTEDKAKCSQEISVTEVSPSVCQNVSDAVTSVTLHTEKDDQNVFEDQSPSLTLPSTLNHDKIDEAHMGSNELHTNPDDTADSQTNMVEVSSSEYERTSNKELSAPLPEDELVKVEIKIEAQNDTNDDLSVKVISSQDVKKTEIESDVEETDNEILHVNVNQLTHSDLHDPQIANKVEELYVDRERKPEDMQVEKEDSECSQEHTCIAKDPEIQIPKSEVSSVQKTIEKANSQNHEISLSINNMPETPMDSKDLDIAIKKINAKRVEISDHSCTINDKKVGGSLLISNNMATQERKYREVSEPSEAILHVKQDSHSTDPISESLASDAGCSTVKKNLEIISSQELCNAMPCASENKGKEISVVEDVHPTPKHLLCRTMHERNESLHVEDIEPDAKHLPSAIEDERKELLPLKDFDPATECAQGDEEKESFHDKGVSPVDKLLSCATVNEPKNSSVVEDTDPTPKHLPHATEHETKESLHVEDIKPDVKHLQFATEDERKESLHVEDIKPDVKHLQFATEDERKESLPVKDIDLATEHSLHAKEDGGKESLHVMGMSPVGELLLCATVDETKISLAVEDVDPANKHLPCATEHETDNSLHFEDVKPDARQFPSATEEEREESLPVKDLDVTTEKTDEAKESLHDTVVCSTSELLPCTKVEEREECFVVKNMNSAPKYLPCAIDHIRKDSLHAKDMEKDAKHLPFATEDEKKETWPVKDLDPSEQSLGAKGDGKKESSHDKDVDPDAEHLPCATGNKEEESLVVEDVDPTSEHLPCAKEHERNESVHVEDTEPDTKHSPSAAEDETKESLPVKDLDSPSEHLFSTKGDEVKEEEGLRVKAEDPAAERLLCAPEEERKESSYAMGLDPVADNLHCVTDKDSGVDPAPSHLLFAPEDKRKETLCVKVVDQAIEHTLHETKDEEKESLQVEDVDTAAENLLHATEGKGKKSLPCKNVVVVAEHLPCATDHEEKETFLVKNLDSGFKYLPCATEDKVKESSRIKDVDPASGQSPHATSIKRKKSLRAKRLDPAVDPASALGNKEKKMLLVKDMDPASGRSHRAIKIKRKASLPVKEKAPLAEMSGYQKISDGQLTVDICSLQNTDSEKNSQKESMPEVVSNNSTGSLCVKNTENNLTSDNVDASKSAPNTSPSFSTTLPPVISLPSNGKVPCSGDKAQDIVCSQVPTPFVKDLGNGTISVDILKSSVGEYKKNIVSNVPDRRTSINACEESEIPCPPFTCLVAERTDSNDFESETQVESSSSKHTANDEQEYSNIVQHPARDSGLENLKQEVSCDVVEETGKDNMNTVIKIEENTHIKTENTESENLEASSPAITDSSKNQQFVNTLVFANESIRVSDQGKNITGEESKQIIGSEECKGNNSSEDQHNRVNLHNEKCDAEIMKEKTENCKCSDKEDSAHTSEVVTSNESVTTSNALISPLVPVNDPISVCDVEETGTGSEPPILLCNVSIVADARKVVVVDLGKPFISENVICPSDMASNERKESKSSTIENIHHSENKEEKEQKTETCLNSNVIEDNCHETVINVVNRESNDMCIKSSNFCTDDQELYVTDITSNAAVERKPLLLENLSIALAGEMEDCAGQLASHEINFKIDTFDIDTSDNNEKVLTSQDTLPKTLENSDFQVDSLRSYRNDKKIYSTLDLQQILEGSDDSKQKLDDDDDDDDDDKDDDGTADNGGDKTVGISANENSSTRSEDLTENLKELGCVKPQLTCKEDELSMSPSNVYVHCDNVKDSQNSKEKNISPQFEKLTELSNEHMKNKSDLKDVKKRVSDACEVIVEKPLDVRIGVDLSSRKKKIKLLEAEFDVTTCDRFEKIEEMEETYKNIDSSREFLSNKLLSGSDIQKSESSTSKEISCLPIEEKLKSKPSNGTRLQASLVKKRRHTADCSPESKNSEENCRPSRKRKRRSSLCLKTISDYHKNPSQLKLVKDEMRKEQTKLPDKLETLKTGSYCNLSLSGSTTSNIVEKEMEPLNKIVISETNNSELCTEIEEQPLDQKSNNMEISKIKCSQESVCSPIPSNSNIQVQKRKLEDTDSLFSENNCTIGSDVPPIDTKADMKTVTEDKLTDHKPKRRRKSVENTTSEAEAPRSSRRQSRRSCRINLLMEDGSSNSSGGSGFDAIEGKRHRRSSRKNKNLNNVTLDENSTSNEASEGNVNSSMIQPKKKCETEPLQKILPFDAELSVMSEDSVFSQSDSFVDVDTRSNYSLELLDDSASSTIGSIVSEDSKDCQEDLHIENDDGNEIEPPMKGSRGRGRSRGRRRRGQGRRRGRGGRGRGASRGNSLTRDSSESLDAKEVEAENEEEVPQLDPEEEVQCGKCAEKMQRKFYDRHNISVHNGLSWLEGEPPFDMNNEKKILSILWRVLKNNKKQLTCDSCGVTKKSAVGFHSHLDFCQRTAEEREALKVKCDICGRYMIPASLRVHQQVHKAERKPLPENFADTMRTKRAAATKATSLMQEVIKEESEIDDKKKQSGAGEENMGLYQRIGPVKPSNPVLSKWKRLIATANTASCIFPGCSFASSDVQQLVVHFGNCEKSPKRIFRCEVCDFQSKSEGEMKTHLENEHIDGPDADSDPEDLDSLKKYQPKAYGWKVCNKLLFLAREMRGSINGDRPYIPAVKWTLKFWRENYTTEDLFPEYHTHVVDWLPVLESVCEEYLPQTKESISFATIAMRGEVINTDAIEFQWKKMKIFESEIIDGVPTLFTGGPIWALAWCTVPLSEIQSEATEQFLALSSHQQMSDTYKSNEHYVGKGLIQLWNFGPLDNLQRPTSSPRFALGIAHDYGVIWDMEWCPSGCYETTSTDKHNQRLGLLATACSDGCVHIFSVCFPSSLKSSERYPIFKCKPVMSLMVNKDPMHQFVSLPWSCLRLSWYKGKGHSIIAGGFNNGIVALWNIKTESALLKEKSENTHVLLPYHSYPAHLSCITALSLAPQDEGRYLMTGSIDSTMKVWDVEDTSRPIPPIVRKGMVTDGIWLTHWLSSVTSYDDVYCMGHCNTTLNPPRGYGFKIFPLLPQNSVTWSLSTTDWVNGIAQSTHAGELTAIFPHQLMLNVDTEKGMKDKRLILSYVELKDIVKDNKEHSCNASCPVPCQKKQLVNIKNVVENGKHSKESSEAQIVFQLEEADESERGLTFIVERNPRRGKKCVIRPLLENSSNTNTKPASDSSSKKGNVDVQDVIEDVEDISVLNQHERKLLLNFKKDLERLNVTSKLKVTFPYHNSERKKSNSNDTVKEYLMIVSSVKDDDKMEENSTERSAAVPHKVADKHNSQFAEISDNYRAVESKFGMVFCDFPADDMASIPAASRRWMRRSESMRTASVEMYPITSLNKVKWNPNCHSFLWLAAGYQCGLLRVPCISGMHNREVEHILRNSSGSGHFRRGFSKIP